MSRPEHSSESVFITTKDFLVTGEEFRLVHDAELDMLRTTPQPENLEKYYESEAYISHTDSNKGIMAKAYQWVKKYALRKKVGLISRLHRGKGTLLDIGAGTGDFLVAAQKSGWEIEGVEVNPEARTRASEKGIDLQASLDAVSEKQFDVVTLWHVLEHLPDLEETVGVIQGLVKPGGVLIIAVPNFKSADAKKYGRFWAAYDVPRHLWHFSRTTIPKLFSEMKLLTIKPMIFDSFYVSLLSEKYKNGSSFSLRAIWSGFRSNLSASTTGEYSSLIYCLKKPK